MIIRLHNFLLQLSCTTFSCNLFWGSDVFYSPLNRGLKISYNIWLTTSILQYASSHRLTGKSNDMPDWQRYNKQVLFWIISNFPLQLPLATFLHNFPTQLYCATFLCNFRSQPSYLTFCCNCPAQLLAAIFVVLMSHEQGTKKSLIIFDLHYPFYNMLPPIDCNFRSQLSCATSAGNCPAQLLAAIYFAVLMSSIVP